MSNCFSTYVPNQWIATDKKIPLIVSGQNSAGKVITRARPLCFANQWISQDILSLSSQSECTKMDIHWFDAWYLLKVWFLSLFPKNALNFVLSHFEIPLNTKFVSCTNRKSEANDTERISPSVGKLTWGKYGRCVWERRANTHATALWPKICTNSRTRGMSCRSVQDWNKWNYSRTIFNFSRIENYWSWLSHIRLNTYLPLCSTKQHFEV